MLPQIDQSNNLEPQVPLETGTYLSDLVTSNPAASDPLSTADDHMRLMKAMLVNTFPGLGAPLTRSPGGIILPTDGSSSAPAIAFSSEPTLGIFRESAGVMRVAGGALKGAIPVGAVFMFIGAPANFGSGGGAGTGYDWLELDGSTWNISAYPALATNLGTGTGSTFFVPNMKDTGRFPRSRSGAFGVWNAQGNQNKTHTHAFSGTTGGQSVGHTHDGSGTTGGMNANNPHNHGLSGTVNTVGAINNNNGGGGGSFAALSNTSVSVNSTDISHGHDYSFTTGNVSSDHTHGISGTTSGGSADGTEARPEALTFIFCIKT